MHEELSENLRFFVLNFIGADPDVAPEQSGFTAKPKIQMARLLDLDALSHHVSSAIATVTSADDLSEFGLKEALACRKKWSLFQEVCWTYATEMCLIEKPSSPPEYFQMKARLAARVTSRGTGTASMPVGKLTGRATPQGTPFGTISEDGPGDGGFRPGPPPPSLGSSPRQPLIAGSSSLPCQPSPPLTEPQVLERLEVGPPRPQDESSVPEVTGPPEPPETPILLPGMSESGGPKERAEECLC